MHRTNVLKGILAVVFLASACASQIDSPDVPPPAATPPAGAPAPSTTASDVGSAPSPAPAPSPADPVAPVAISPTRMFTCDATSVTADTQLTQLANGVDALVLRPSGAACANHLVFASSSSAEHVVSSAPGMIVLASAGDVGSSLVVCLSNERHLQVPGGGPLDRYSDGVALECSVRVGSNWSATRTVIPSAADSAAWLVAIVPDANATDRLTVRWFRDSQFQFLHMVPDGRPASDGIYETAITIVGADLVVGATTRSDGDLFVTPQPTLDVGPPPPP